MTKKVKLIKDKLHERKREQYEKDKDEVQRRRIIKEINKAAEGDHSARKPSIRTLTKYGLYDSEKKKIVIPETFKNPTINYTDVEKPETQKTINIVVKKTNKPVEKYDDSNTEINGAEIKNWVYTVLSVEKMKGGQLRSKKTLDLYANTTRNLFKIRGEKYDENKNAISYYKDATETLNYIDKYKSWKTAATKSKNLSGVLFLIQNYPPLQSKISESVVEIYDAEYKKYGNTGKAQQMQATANKALFEWSIIRKYTLAFYDYPNKNTYESLIVLLYNDIIARDDFGCLMAYKPDEVKDDNNNYCLLDRNKKTATIFLNKYKTSGHYKSQVIKLSSKTAKNILELHPTDVNKTLFEPTNNNKIGAFISNTFKKVPLFKNEGINIKYLRHSIISSALARIKTTDPKYADKIEALAAKSFHKVSTQNTYLSPLKDAKGKRYEVNPEIVADYDTFTTVQEGSSEESEGEEEINSKKKKS